MSAASSSTSLNEAVSRAEADLDAMLRSKGRDDEEIADAIHAVRNDPHRYQPRQDEHGTFARCLLAANGREIMNIVPYVPSAVVPSPVARQPSVIELDCARVANHKYFTPLGPKIKSDAPADHHYSHMRIDHSVSGFKVGSQEEKALVLIYTHLMYESKCSPCKEVPWTHRAGADPGDRLRGPFYTVREHDHKQPADAGAHAEVLIFGSTQLSKTPEAVATAWCAFFIDGCVPILGVRNKGGANIGSTDMASGVEKLNKLIEGIFKEEVKRGNIGLPEDDYKKFLLAPRKTSDGEQLKFNPNTLKLWEPQVLIICMNAGQVKTLINSGNKATANSGATAGLLDIMKGDTNHPYPPKCHDPYVDVDSGVNRPLARLYFILDEDDLNRSNVASAVCEKLQFNASPQIKKRLEAGLDKLYPQPRPAAGTSNDPLPVGSDNDDLFDDDEAAAAAGLLSLTGPDTDAQAEARARSEFRDSMESTGLRSVVRGVVALTATPAACGHDLAEAASTVKHNICVMEHPANYVGYEFTAAPYAERMIKHEQVPDRKQIVAIKKGILYEEAMKKNGWWDNIHDIPRPPFRKRPDGAIMVYQKELDDIKEEGNLSSRDIWTIVDNAQKDSSRRGNKVIESDGVGIALMLESMSELPASEEPERRALIVSNFTKKNEQKIQLAHHILEGDLTFEDDRKLPDKCVCDLFVIIFDYHCMRIMWRGATGDDDLNIPSDHDSLDVLNAIRAASNQLYEGCWTANQKTGSEPQIEVDGMCKMFRTHFININHAYTALQLYAQTKRRVTGKPFKLKTVALSGDIGGRGVNYKPHGCGHNPRSDTWNVRGHQGYLTDMFFMFDAVKNRQIATHGEYILQAIGRLCTLTIDEELAKMEKTPPRLWTSNSCYNVIATFSRGVKQWVEVMKTKQPGESMSDALQRCIKAEPERFGYLYMLLVVPTTDRRWAKKDLWLRQSRLTSKENAVGKDLREAPQMPTPGTLRTPNNHGINFDPDAEARKRTQDLIAKSQARGTGGEEDEEEEEEAAAARPKRPRFNARINSAAMVAKFTKIYQQCPHLKYSDETAPGGKQPMPNFDQKVWVKYNHEGPYQYYPATVKDIKVDAYNTGGEADRADRSLYTITFESPWDANPVQIHLDPDMHEWQYTNPNDPNADVAEI